MEEQESCGISTPTVGIEPTYLAKPALQAGGLPLPNVGLGFKEKAEF